MSPGIPCETEHEFALILGGISDVDDEAADALFAAGCDDCTVSVRGGRVSLTFVRTSPSMRDAISSAIKDVQRAGIGATILRIDDCNLVTQAEIARKIGRTRQQVFQYVTGERGSGSFPPPACRIAEKAPLWKWCEVAHWLWQNSILKENALRSANRRRH